MSNFYHVAGFPRSHHICPILNSNVNCKIYYLEHYWACNTGMYVSTSSKLLVPMSPSIWEIVPIHVKLLSFEHLYFAYKLIFFFFCYSFCSSRRSPSRLPEIPRWSLSDKVNQWSRGKSTIFQAKNRRLYTTVLITTGRCTATSTRY